MAPTGVPDTVGCVSGEIACVIKMRTEKADRVTPAYLCIQVVASGYVSFLRLRGA